MLACMCVIVCDCVCERKFVCVCLCVCVVFGLLTTHFRKIPLLRCPNHGVEFVQLFPADVKPIQYFLRRVKHRCFAVLLCNPG